MTRARRSMTPTRQAMTHPRHSRSGAIGPALSAAVALLAILGLLLFNHLQRTSATLAEAIAGAGGALAEELAASAVEEATWRLNHAFTDPHDPLFARLRQELIRGRTRTLDLSQELAPAHLLDRMRGARARPLYRAAALERFRVIVQLPAAKDGGEQLVDFDAGVALTAGGRGVYRRVVQRRRYGVMLIAPPKPFDRTTFAVLDHSGVPALKAAVDALTARCGEFALSRKLLHRSAGLHEPGEALEESAPFPPPFVRYGRAPRMTGSALTALLRHKPKASSSAGWDDWDRVAGDPAAQASCTPPVGVISSAYQVNALSPAGPIGVSAKQTIVSTADSVELAGFDYEVRVRDEFEARRRTFETECQSYNDFWLRWIGPENWPSNDAQRKQMLAGWAGGLRNLRERQIELIRIADGISRHANEHGRSGLSARQLAHYLHTSSHRLYPLAYHAESSAHLAAAFADYPAINAHVSYCGPDSAAFSDRSFAGAAVISARANTARETDRRLSVGDFYLRDRKQDLAVITADLLDLTSAGIEAGLVARDRLFLHATPRVFGNLTIHALRPLAERSSVEELGGQVTFDARLAAGPFWEPARHDAAIPELPLDHYIVTLSPRDMTRALLRARPGEGTP